MTGEAARIIRDADPGSLGAYYTELHGAQRSAELADAVTAGVEPLLDDARQDLERARALVVQAEQRVRALEQLQAAARAVGDDLPLEQAALTGRRIADAAIEVAVAAGRHELHYRDWFTLFRAAGHFVAGDNPQGAFFTAITRHPQVEPVGVRTGVYRIVDEQAPE